MDVISHLSSLSSSFAACRKVCRSRPSAHIESSLPQRFSQRYMSCMSFMCPCWTSWLQCFTVSAGGVSTAGGAESNMVYLSLISVMHTPAVPPTAPPPKTVRCNSFVLLRILSFCTKAHSSAWIFTGEFSHSVCLFFFCKCNPSYKEKKRYSFSCVHEIWYT